MALIKKAPVNNSANQNYGAMVAFEDPRSSSTYYYFYNEAHDKTTFAPIMNKYLINTTLGGPGFNIGNCWSNWSGSGAVRSAGLHGMTVSTGGLCINQTLKTAVTTNGWLNLVDITPHFSMDPDNLTTGSKLFQSGNDQMVTHTSGYREENQRTFRAWSVGTVTDLANQTPSAFYDTDEEHGQDYYSVMYNLTYLDNQGKVQGVTQEMTNGDRDDGRYGFISTNFPSGTLSSHSSRWTENYGIQYIGAEGNKASGLGAYGIYLSQNKDNDYQHYINKYDAGSNARTQLHAFTTSHSGGNRTQPGNLGRGYRLASKHFSTGGEDRAFYAPYFNTSENYIPWYYEWDVSLDTFTRSECTIIGTSSTSAGLTQNRDYFDDNYAMSSSVLYNETFVFSGTRYVTIFPITSDYDYNDGAAGGRTFVTYSAGAADPSALTYHSATTAEKTIVNVLWTNDDRTKMITQHSDKIVFYKFDASNGWVKTSEFSGKVHGLGKTVDGTLFAAVNDQGDDHCSLHALSEQIPLSITVDAADSAYTYSGTNINTNLVIAAKDFNDSNVACDITLEIDGSTMKFDSASGPITKSITLSNSGSTNQPVTIVGSGNSTVITKLEI